MTRFLATTLFFILLTTSGILANCTAPTGLQSLNNSDGVLLSWNTASGAISYWLKVENANNNPQVYEIEIPVNATSYLVSNLNANASYKFKVRTKCSDGKSAWTEYVSFQTATVGGGTGGGNNGRRHHRSLHNTGQSGGLGSNHHQRKTQLEPGSRRVAL
ncbi:MAG: fibronectin type III domain-containing protein [Saprospiraceae bacterium]|nr:fibronectin type III domain-containing protein [Saprospiraceae bacterium]